MATYTFSNSSGMTLADAATASQGLVVSGMLGTITSVQITLNGLSHTFPLDLDMLLVAPDGAHNLLFWSDAGGQDPLADGTYSIADGGSALGQSTPPSGTYAPADFDAIETMADFGLSGSLNSASTTSLAQAFSSAGNGTWRLYIKDDAFQDVGSLAGWGLTITTDFGGTSGDDTLAITNAGSGTGSYSLNFGASVNFSGVPIVVFDAGLGDDIVLGSAGDESIRGGGGRDVIALGGGNDFVVVAGGDDVAGENYNGGANLDELQFSSGESTGDVVIDLTDDSVAGFESFRFMDDFADETTVTVKLNAAQFVNAAFYGTFNGDVAEIVDITMQSAATLNMDSTAGFTDPYDRIIVRGSTGDDVIYGGAGRDSIDGSTGIDIIHSNGGIDTLRGGANDDILDLYNSMIVSGVVLDGGTGTDALVIESPNTGYSVDFAGVTVTGIETLTLNYALNGVVEVDISATQFSFSAIESGFFVASDFLLLNIAMDTANLDLHALSFVDWLTVSVEITGQNTNETIIGSSVGETINAGGGFDTIKGMGGNDTIDGGAGGDTADYSDKQFSVQVFLDANNDSFSTAYVATSAVSGVFTEDSLVRVEHLTGGAGGDVFVGNSLGNFFNGNGGNDTLTGGDGSDFLSGGANDDSLSGGNQDDFLIGGTGKDTIDGGLGSDGVDYHDKGQKVTVTLKTSSNATVFINGTAAGNAEDTLRNVENVNGGTAGDVITGDGSANRIQGFTGKDTLDGGLGSDTADYNEKTQKVTIALNGSTPVTVYVNGTAAANAEDSIKNFENLIGGSSTDKLTGDGFGNKFDGQAGADTLDGKGANDTLIGGDGNDTLIGGAGIDSLTGGANDDVFRYLAVSDSTPAARDIITDFDDSGNDRIDVSALFGPTMTYRGTSSFNAAGQVRVVASGSDVIVEVNTSGSSGAEFAIKLSATAIGAMGIDDFIL